MRKKILSERLLKVVNMVTPCDCVCDVGCDHAFASIYMVEQGIAKRCLACDVRPGPIASAGSNIKKHGLEDVIETRLGSGLSKVEEGEADCVIMAGMGGMLIESIIKDDMDTALSIHEWVLEPQSDFDIVRRLIRECGFVIDLEDMVTERDKIYPVIRAVKNTKNTPALDEEDRRICKDLEITEEELLKVYDSFGRYLLRSGNKILEKYINKGLAKYDNVIMGIKNADGADEKSLARLKEMEEAKALSLTALKIYKLYLK